MLEVRLSARCYATEDREKVLHAMANIFPDAEFTGDDLIVGKSSSVERLGELLKQYRIRDSARSVLRRGLRGNTTSFKLNKQVAAIGKVSFAEELHPLGDIEVTLASDNLEAVIDSIAQSTRRAGP
jgi:predicted RNA binding protein with dsRBD fold (UPF0201 family)